MRLLLAFAALLCLAGGAFAADAEGPRAPSFARPAPKQRVADERLRQALDEIAELRRRIDRDERRPKPNGSVRIKDVSSLQGVRDNQLVGYGLVVGLQNTGDTLRNSPFTEQAMQSMLSNMGINVRNTSLRARNVAAVIVTANLPPFITPGTRIDVSVSSLGDASSLMGGTLILTSLQGVDGKTYGVAQGSLSVSGFAAQGQAETLSQGVPTAGRIPNGALIERQVPGAFGDSPTLTLTLRNPDFKTAVRIADAINDYTGSVYGVKAAQALDYRSVSILKPRQVSAPRFMAEIGDLAVEPDTPARVVVDERTGTVVIGQDVQISTVAVTHGSLTVRITETPQVSQPEPFSKGKTTVVPSTVVDASEQGGHMAILGGTNLRTLVRGLNQIGMKPSGIIAILQTIKTAGALQADLVIQ
jgi:flagellar P-ring protein precursor FlgI